MVEQLDLQGDRYLLIVAIFFIPYVLFEFPSNLLMSESKSLLGNTETHIADMFRILHSVKMDCANYGFLGYWYVLSIMSKA